MGAEKREGEHPRTGNPVLLYLCVLHPDVQRHPQTFWGRQSGGRFPGEPRQPHPLTIGPEDQITVPVVAVLTVAALGVPRQPRRPSLSVRSRPWYKSLTSLSEVSLSTGWLRCPGDLPQTATILTQSTCRPGSGTVVLQAVAAPARLRSQSGSITARDVRSDVQVNAGSGRVHVALTGTGDVDIESQSSAITISGATSGLITHTESGHITVAGTPHKQWRLSSDSSAIDVTLLADTAVTLTATTGSGSIQVDGALVDGAVARRDMNGRIRGGMLPLVISSRSGSIRIKS